MNINYDYITYEDVLRARRQMYENAVEENATKSLLNSARELFDNGSFDMCIRICEGLLDAKIPKQLYDAKKLIALSHYSKEDFEKADDAFYALTENSTNSDDYFNAVICAALNKNFERSKELFSVALDKYTHHGTQKNMPSVQLILHYMITLIRVEEFELAKEQFQLLKQIYMKVKTTDESVLRSRALEPIEGFLEISTPILKLYSEDELEIIYDDLYSCIDSEGKDKIEAYFSSIVS
jgi:tetratricopeptide (TPR) repeat protein